MGCSKLGNFNSGIYLTGVQQAWLPACLYEKKPLATRRLTKPLCFNNNITPNSKHERVQIPGLAELAL